MRVLWANAVTPSATSAAARPLLPVYWHSAFAGTFCVSDIDRFICFDLHNNPNKINVGIVPLYSLGNRLREVICPKSCILLVTELGCKPRTIGSKAVDSFVVSTDLGSFFTYRD